MMHRQSLKVKLHWRDLGGGLGREGLLLWSHEHCHGNLWDGCKKGYGYSCERVMIGELMERGRT